MNRFIIAFIFILQTVQVVSQTDSTDEAAFGRQIFLPSIEVGYIFQLSDDLSGGIIMKTSIEYRLRNNNDVFFRLNYDNYSSEYQLSSSTNPADILEGTTVFSDILLGGGYRFGDRKHRFFLMAQPGIKLYDYPIATFKNNSIQITKKREEIFTTRFSLGYEYYFNEKSAVNFDLIHNQVWDNSFFWSDSGVALGFSVGFITSLF